MYDKLILGEGVEYSTNSLETQLNNNVVIVGGSGSGKSMSYLETKLLKLFCSNAFIKISKEKLIKKYRALLVSRGYNVEILDLVNLAKSTVSFDPLYYVKSDADVTHLAEALVNLDPKKSFQTKADPYWDEESVLLLVALIYMSLAIDEEPTTLSDVIRYIKKLKISDSGSTITTNLDSIFDSIEEQRPDHPCLSSWHSFKQLPSKTARCVYGSLLASINAVFTEEMLEMIENENKLDFEKSAKEKTVIFVLTSAVSPSLHSFSNLFFSYAIKELYEYAEKQPNGELPIPVELICDDFAVGCIKNFQDQISIFREKKISTSILLQSESQLYAVYGDDNAKTIINNCDTYVYMGGMEIMTAEHISKRIDLPLEDVLYMPIGQEIIFRRGQKPIITKRYDILNNKLYQKITKHYEMKHNDKAFNKKVDSSKQKLEKINIEKSNEFSEEDLQAQLEAKFDELFGPIESA